MFNLACSLCLLVALICLTYTRGSCVRNVCGREYECGSREILQPIIINSHSRQTKQSLFVPVHICSGNCCNGGRNCHPMEWRYDRITVLLPNHGHSGTLDNTTLIIRSHQSCKCDSIITEDEIPTIRFEEEEKGWELEINRMKSLHVKSKVHKIAAQGQAGEESCSKHKTGHIKHPFRKENEEEGKEAELSTTTNSECTNPSVSEENKASNTRTDSVVGEMPSETPAIASELFIIVFLILMQFYMP